MKNALDVRPAFERNHDSPLAGADVPAIRNQLGLGNAESVLPRAYIENAQFNPVKPKEAGIVPHAHGLTWRGAEQERFEL